MPPVNGIVASAQRAETLAIEGHDLSGNALLNALSGADINFNAPFKGSATRYSLPLSIFARHRRTRYDAVMYWVFNGV